MRVIEDGYRVSACTDGLHQPLKHVHVSQDSSNQNVNSMFNSMLTALVDAAA